MDQGDGRQASCTIAMAASRRDSEQQAVWGVSPRAGRRARSRQQKGSVRTEKRKARQWLRPPLAFGSSSSSQP